MRSRLELTGSASRFILNSYATQTPWGQPYPLRTTSVYNFSVEVWILRRLI